MHELFGAGAYQSTSLRDSAAGRDPADETIEKRLQRRASGDNVEGLPPMPDRKTLPPPPPTGAPTDADFAGNPLAC